MLPGCSGELLGADYRGTPLFSFEGSVADYRLDTTPIEALRASIFWSKTGKTSTIASALVEQPNVTLSITFPATMRFRVFEPPASAPMAGADWPFAIGMILIYEDVNGNDRYDHGELRGGAFDQIVTYAEAGLSLAQSPVGRAIPTGYALTPVSLPCARGMRLPPGRNNCGVTLGANCHRDEDCGPNGICLMGVPTGPVPAGYCSMLVRSQGCAPTDGQSDDGRHPSFWLKRCYTDSDCAAPLICSSLDRFCGPRDPLFVDVAEDFDLLPLCPPDFQ